MGGVGKKNEKISSTLIREAISRGDTAAAERMLGRPVNRNPDRRTE
jgi:FAD synthase